MAKVTLQLVVSAAIAAGKCKPQISVRGLPTHKSGTPRSSQVTSNLKFSIQKDGKAVEADLYIADNGGAHEGHQTGEVQVETFSRIFGALQKHPGKVVNVQAEIVDNDGAQANGGADSADLKEIFG